MKLNKIFILFVVASFMASPSFSKNDKSKGNSNSLPPGLEKKHSQGKPLPPGWQKKLSKGDVLDNDIYLRGKVVIPLGKDGSISINVEGSIIKMMEKTREIIRISH